MNQTEYIPGVCNIGGEEVTIRKVAFYILLVATVAVLFFNYLMPPSYINFGILFFVALMLAVTYQQYTNRFCIKYGWKHQFSLGKRGHTQNVFEKEQMKADRKKVMEILVKSFLFAAIFVAVLYFIKTIFGS